MQPYNPYTNPYLAPHLLDPRLRHLNLPVSSAAALRAAGDKHHVKGHHLTDYYIYDVAKIPECAYTNKHYYNLTFCLQDDYYPTYVKYHTIPNPLFLFKKSNLDFLARKFKFIIGFQFLLEILAQKLRNCNFGQKLDFLE